MRPGRANPDGPGPAGVGRRRGDRLTEAVTAWPQSFCAKVANAVSRRVRHSFASHSAAGQLTMIE